MKVQKQLSKKRDDKTYYKYVISIPEKELKKANIKEGDELYVSEHGDGEVRLRKGEKEKGEKE